MSFDPIAYINEPRWRHMSLGLGRTRLLLDELGRPQDALRFVHVAGTNGKGSVCAYTASVLQEAGLRTGLFTSPYIERFEERIRVDGRMIAPGELLDVTLSVRDAAERVQACAGEHPTEFELMCAVALEHFRRSACDIVVLEVGLGGRLDSTNAVEAPEVSVIARIGLDHTAVLGDTLTAVAGEKAGIVKDGVPVATWPQEPDAARVVREAARAHGSPLRETDPSELHAGAVEAGAEGDVPLRPFSYRGRAFRTRLLGAYQPGNAALALEAIELLREGGWSIPDAAVARGIEKTTWPARFEVAPAASGRPTIVLDGGHNPQGARALADSLADVFAGRRPVFVAGVLADKDYDAMLRAVVPCASAFVATAPDNPRALAAGDLAAAVARAAASQGVAALHVEQAGDAHAALECACELAGVDGLVCVFGSLYLAGELRSAIFGPAV